VVKLAKPLDQVRVPPTVQAILASRIDRLAAGEKELLQTLALLGREFSSGLIKRVAGKPDGELEPILSDLQLGEFIYEQPAIPDIEYIFKHALTQEVAYNSLLVTFIANAGAVTCFGVVDRMTADYMSKAPGMSADDILALDADAVLIVRRGRPIFGERIRYYEDSHGAPEYFGIGELHYPTEDDMRYGLFPTPHAMEVIAFDIARWGGPVSQHFSSEWPLKV